MRNYVLCGVFWTIFTLLLHMLGRVATKGKKSESYGLMTGYLVYSILIAVGGMAIQFANLPWVIFAGYTAVIWMVLIAYILYRQKKEPISFFQTSIKQYIKNNWVIYTVLAVFVGMLFFYYRGFWLGNHLDDGYYITKVATLPFTHSSYSANYSVGVVNAGMDSYIFNTWELEASVYIKLLGVRPTLFLRLFQSAFYYFLFLNIVKAFAENILKKIKINIADCIVQYTVIITLLFGIYYVFTTKAHLLVLRDTFHFNTGMFLGGTLVKMLGIVFLLFYYTDTPKLTWEMVTVVMATSLILISKSTIALPIILITVCSYLITCLFFNYEKGGKILSLLFVTAYFLAAIIIPGSSDTQTALYSDVINSLHSPVIIGGIIIFLCSFFLKEKVINRINCIMILSAMLMLVPQVNDIAEELSVYTFVLLRAWTTWVYTFIILNSIYLCSIITKLGAKERVLKACYACLGAVLIVMTAYGFNKTGNAITADEDVEETDVKGCLRVIRNNIYFAPDSTIVLGDSLEQLTKEIDEQLYVVTPEWVEDNQAPHALAVILRTFAPDIVSVSASGRFPVNNGSPLEFYNQDAYAKFVAEPNEKNSAAFEKELDKAEVNCVVTQNTNCSEWLRNMGYELYSVTKDNFYYIWYRPSVDNKDI